MSRKISALAAFSIALFLTLSASAQDNWQLDPNHSAAQFAVRHLGISTVRGTFTKVSGSVQLNEADLTRSSAEVTIDATSVDTRVETRDNDVRSPKFLDAQKFPTITFKSKRVETAGAGKLRMTGDLTIHGVTKEVVLDVDGPTQAVKTSIPASNAAAPPPLPQSIARISASAQPPASSVTRSRLRSTLK